MSGRTSPRLWFALPGAVWLAKSSEIQRSRNMISRDHCFSGFMHLSICTSLQRESMCLCRERFLFSSVGGEGECPWKREKANVVRRAEEGVASSVAPSNPCSCTSRAMLTHPGHKGLCDASVKNSHRGKIDASVGSNHRGRCEHWLGVVTKARPMRLLG